MKNKSISLLFMTSLLVVIFSSNALAFFPATHWHMTDKAIEVPINSNLYQACAKYPDLCYSGNILTDISVVYYYNYFERYAVTHSPSYCRAMLEAANSEEEMACSVGACLHSAQDLMSHEEMVPYSITRTFLPNVFIHPFSEQHLENNLLRDRPEADFRSEGDLNNFNKCSSLVKRVLKGQEEYGGVDIDELMRTFITEIQGSKTGYDVSFSRIQVLPPIIPIVYISFMLFWFLIWTLLIFKKLRYSDRRTTFTWISFGIVSVILFLMIGLFAAYLGGKGFVFLQAVIKPISYLVPITPPQTTIDRGVENSIQFLTQGEIWLQNTDASGALALEKANRKINIPQYIILTMLLLLISLFIWLNLRSRRK